MRSMRVAVLGAVLVVGAAWPGAGFAQTNLTRTSSFAYDPGTGLLTQEVIEPNTPSLRLETDYTYDGFGNKTQVTTSGVDIATRSTTASFAPANGSANGQFPTSQSNALNQSETWQYDIRFGKPTSHTGPNGLTTTWNYDSFGRKTLEVRADGTKTTWSYTSLGAGQGYYVVATPQDQNSNQNGPLAWSLFDTLDRETFRCTQGFDGSSICVQTVYDSFGRVSQKSRPYFYNTGTPQWTTYTYDALGRVVTETLPDGHTVQHAYHGLTTTDTNQNNQTRTVTKNSQGQVISAADALGNVTTYYYDPFGNPVQTIDATGKNIVTAAYDPRGRKISSTDPDLGTWTYGYDVLGQLKSQVDAIGQVPAGQPPSGRVTNFTYDVLGRPVERDEYSALNVLDMTATWSYDTAQYGIGKLASASATGPAAGTNAFQRALTYDSLGRPTQVATTIDQTVYNISGAYDANGRLSRVTYPSGFAVTYGYTSLGYTANITDAGSGQTYWTANARDAELHLTQDTAGNGIITARGFDAPTGRLTSIVAGSGNGVANFSYSYDAVGNPLSRADGNSGITETFTYDTLNRLTSSTLNVSPSPLVKNFAYDSIGNLLTKSDVGNYAYPEPGVGRPHGVVSIDGETVSAAFTYDANGNQTGATGIGRTVTYNGANKTASITQGALTLNFADDVDHQRYKQTRMQGSTITTTSYLDAFGVHVELVASTTTQWNEYLMVGGSMVGVRFVQTSGVTLRYFHQDHLGSVAVLTDATGAVVERDAYDPWGKQRYWANGADDPTGILPGQDQTNRGFTGQEMLASVGLVHLNGRVYDPFIGRMMSADPVVGDPLNGQTWNRYSYVYNNPLAFTDPTGYCPICLGEALSRIGNGIQKFLQRNQLVGQVLIIASAALCGPGAPFCAGVVSTVATFVVTGITTGQLDLALKAAAISAATAMANFAIGEITTHNPGFGDPRLIANVLGHALIGCGSSVASGGKCGPGALAGAIPALAGPVVNKLPFQAALMANTTLGGLASVVGGGKFANGALTAAFGYLFNAEGRPGARFLAWAIISEAFGIPSLNLNEPSQPYLTTEDIENYLDRTGGRLGSTNTRQLNDAIARGLETAGYTVTNGAGRGPEEWIPGPDGTKGGTFIDITATRDGEVIRIQTIDTLTDNTPTSRELAAAARIRTVFPNDRLLLVPK